MVTVRTDRDWQPLIDVLRRYGDRRFTVLEPGGNNGDELVYRGLEKLLEHQGITFDSLAPSQYEGHYDRRKRKLNAWLEGILGAAPFPVPNLRDPQVLLIHGGGNFHFLFDHGLTLFRRLVKHYPETPIIVAPQTAWTPDGRLRRTLESTRQPVHFFCRERYSYHHLKSGETLPSNVELGLAPDTALYLDRADLERFVLEDVEGLDLSGAFDLLAFRGDKLGLVSQQLLDNLRAASDRAIQLDVSDASTFTFREFVSIVSAARSVHTTRLHGAILAHLLDTPVTLYDLAYFKNRAVYQFSFVDRSEVRFREPC